MTKRDGYLLGGLAVVLLVGALALNVIRGGSDSGQGEYLVRVETLDSAFSTMQSLPGVDVLSRVDDPLLELGWLVVDVSSEDAVGELRSVPGVVDIEKNGRIELWEPITEGEFREQNAGDAALDPYVNAQWQLAKIEAPSAWGVGTGAGQVVAVIDTGVDCDHPDLVGNMLTGYDAVTQVASCPNDKFGHGTHVAGAAIAAMNGSQGAGVAYGAKLLPVKVFADNGYAQWDDLARGILWADSHGADVMNLSLGGNQISAVLSSAIASVIGHGVVVVAAAGNSGSTNCGYPASYPGVLSVGATTTTDTRPSWSNYGSCVDIGAPGVSTYAATFDGGYSVMSGTSMSSPVVAGAAAVLLSGGVMPSDILSVVQGTDDPCAGCGFNAGRLNLGSAVVVVPGPPTPTGTTEPPPTGYPPPTTGRPPTFAYPPPATANPTATHQSTAYPPPATVRPLPTLTSAPTATALPVLGAGCWKIERIACP